MVDTVVPNNPYVGPRAIQSGEAFYGRDKEIRSLSALLISERIVLLHSPSGAGKSSLIQAGLAPRMAERLNVLPLARVNLEPPDELRGLVGVNRYVFSALLSLDEGLPPERRTPLPQLAALSLPAYLSARLPQPPEASPPTPDAANILLIFDQFEEVLTASLTDAPAKQEFFEQLGEVLQNRRCWALFSIREDYMGGLAPYVRAIPNRLAVTFRLGLLGPDAARLAIQQPAKNKEVDFTDAAAGRLVDDLRRIQVQQPDGSFVTEAGPDIEPVQLQVVCYNLWQSHAADDKVIDENDLQRVGSVDQALASYYAKAARSVAESTGTDERLLRRWVDEHLITPDGIRSQVLKGAESTEGLPNIVLRLLENTHLLRGETRAGKTWYELSHDRLVKPVRQNNTSWFEENLTLLQRQSVLWNQQGRGEGLLLRGAELETAERESGQSQLADYEQAFLQACLGLRRRERRELVQKRLVRVGFVTSVILLVVAVWALYLVSQQTAHARAETNRANEQSTLAIREANQRSTAQAGGTQLALGALEAQVAATQTMSAFSISQAQTAEALAEEGLYAAATSQANAEFALEQARVAAGYRAQSLADASRLQWRNNKITLATLLAIEGFRISDDYHTRGILLEILGNSIRIPLPNRTAQANLSDSGMGQNVMSFNPDGSVLAAGYVDGTVVLWEMPDLDWLGMRGEGSTPRVSGLDYSPDGKTIFKSEFSRIFSLWDATQPGTQPDSIGSMRTDQSDDILCMALGPDGSILATGSQDGTIRLWNAASLEPIGEPLRTELVDAGASRVLSLAFSPDGGFLASAHRDGGIRLWDVRTQKPVGDPLIGHGEDVYTVRFSPDGTLLASGGQDRRVIFWDVQTHAMIEDPLAGHGNAVNSVAFSPDGRMLLSGSNDRTVILWDVDNHRMIEQLDTESLTGINNVVMHPSGKLFATGSWDGYISLWNLDGPAWIGAACRKAGRNFTRAEWDLYFPGEEPRTTCPQFPPVP